MLTFMCSGCDMYQTWHVLHCLQFPQVCSSIH